MKRLFLSYSVGGDPDGRDFVRHLFDRLQQQEVDPWVFESPRGEIAAGGSIADACRRKIEECDVFVVFINDRALQSDYVMMEASHALSDAGRRRLPIVPLIATLRLKREWPAALAEMTGFKGLQLPMRAVEALETVVIHVCRCLELEYVPPKPHAPRLPLRQRLAQELQGCQSTPEHEAGRFIQLLRRCDLVVEALGSDDYGRARRLLEAVLAELELEYGIHDPYYPRIVYGAVLMAEADAGRRPFGDVEKHFADIIAEDGPRLDANAFAGLANALLSLERFEEALTAYQAAEPYLEHPDAALFYNMIRARVLGGLSIDPAEIHRRHVDLESGLVTRVPGDLARLTSSLALGYAYSGAVADALATWRDVGDIDAVFPELVADVVHHLHRAGLEDRRGDVLEAARGIAADYIARRPDLSAVSLLPLRQLTIRVVFDGGQRHLARRQLATLIDQFPNAPILRVDAAMFALADHDRREARSQCEAVVALTDHSQCCPALSSRHFSFLLGHAFWLLGRRPEATESFRRSAYRPAQWYGTTMGREFASAH